MVDVSVNLLYKGKSSLALSQISMEKINKFI